MEIFCVVGAVFCPSARRFRFGGGSRGRIGNLTRGSLDERPLE